MKITARDRKWLTHFAEGNENVPDRMGPQGISNFVTRGWIIRMESFQDFDAPRYRLTPKGVAAHQELNSN
ncbi:MAG: hypothetical protein K2X59_13620 [Sphingomonas sp.]|nr:hypothetical protein [Sphingomonas sp.]